MPQDGEDTSYAIADGMCYNAATCRLQLGIRILETCLVYNITAFQTFRLNHKPTP